MPKAKQTQAAKHAQLIRLYVLARDTVKYATLKRDAVAEALKTELRAAPGQCIDTPHGIARLHDVEQNRFDQKKAKVVLGPRYDECFSVSKTATLEVQPNREGEMAASSREFASVTESDHATAETTA